MKFLVFDTETTGLPKTKYINPTTLEYWPHIVQFSYVVYDSSLNEIIESNDFIIKMPENILIPEESSQIHGITNNISNEKGVSLTFALNEFFNSLKNVDILVGHNINFDINMIKVSLLRIINDKSYSPQQIKQYKENFHYILNYNKIVCTLKDSISFCNINLIDKNGKSYLKYPKLSELHEKLFNKTPNNLHNSFYDVLVTLRCFMKLKYCIDLNTNCESFAKYSNKLF
jgi:DNA polymerase III epsilon subunit-like protein